MVPSAKDLAANGVAFFTCFLPMKMVQSPFFIGMLNMFGLHITQLYPNAVLVTAILSQFCEGFLGMRQSVGFIHPSKREGSNHIT
jgi:hypothetical protein